MIIDSKFEEGPPQEDGRRYVREVHTDDKGATFVYEWLGTQDANAVLELRSTELNRLLQKQRAAEQLVDGTLLPLTKYQFRKLFTQYERTVIDAFEVSFESNQNIDENTKSIIRSGFKDFNAAQEVTRPFPEEVVSFLGLFVIFGLLTEERKAQIVSAGNG